MVINQNLTQGNIAKSLVMFLLPMIFGNMIQQLYNVADTLIVSHALGSNALAAVGSSFTLMTFLTSIVLGLSMGSGIVFSHYYGANNSESLKKSFVHSFIFIFVISLLINLFVLYQMDWILNLLQIPIEIYTDTKVYLVVICYGFMFVTLFNYFAAVLRSIGNSFFPLIVLSICALTNIVLDLYFVFTLNLGIAGAAWATVISQAASALILLVYCLWKVDILKIKQKHLKYDAIIFKNIVQYSLLTSIQQSIMNFGILMVQGLINSFGTVVMAGFAAAVKIDSFAYMPAQDFGNAFSTFIAQNYGADKKKRIYQGIKIAGWMSIGFCLIISILVVCFAKQLMMFFVSAEKINVINVGIQYLQIEASCYIGIGILFLLYGYYRGIGKPSISIVLTIISLGLRVVLAYTLSSIPSIGLMGIWWSVPIGWILADITGFVIYRHLEKQS